MKKKLITLAMTVGVLAGSAGYSSASAGERNLGYALGEMISAPFSFVVGGIKDIAKDPIQGTYNLTGRAASEAGRVVNGATNLITGNKYGAKFGEIDSWADNDVVKTAGWGVVFAPVAPWTYVEGLLGGTAIGVGSEILKKR